MANSWRRLDKHPECYREKKIMGAHLHKTEIIVIWHRFCSAAFILPFIAVTFIPNCVEKWRFYVFIFSLLYRYFL